jgi:ABC-2 type transport system permease protein
MRAVLALALKDLRVLTRVRAALFFTFLWPVFVAVLFGFVFSGQASERGRAAMQIAMVDEDQTDRSRAFIARLDESPEIDVTPASPDDASDLVRRGQRAAFVVVKKGYGEASERLFYGPSRQVEVGIDPSRQAEAGMLQGLLIKYAMEDVQQLFTNTAASRQAVQEALSEIHGIGTGATDLAPVERFLGELDRFLAAPQPQGGPGQAGAWQPLAVRTTDIRRERVGPANAFEVTFPQGVMWGLIGCVMTFAISLVTERVHGTLTRLRMAPLTRAQILGGKAAACFAAMLLVQVILFGLGVGVFGIRPHSWAALVAIAVSSGIAFVGFMMLIAGIGRTEQGTSGAGWAMLMPMTLFGGGMMPQFVMPSWMITVGALSPVTWVIRGMEGAIWRGFSPAEMALPCGILLAFGAVCFALGVRALREG